MQIFLYLCGKFTEYEKSINCYCFINLEHYALGAVTKCGIRSVY